jgi:hypothetical protein
LEEEVAARMGRIMRLEIRFDLCKVIISHSIVCTQIALAPLKVSSQTLRSSNSDFFNRKK